MVGKCRGSAAESRGARIPFHPVRTTLHIINRIACAGAVHGLAPPQHPSPLLPGGGPAPPRSAKRADPGSDHLGALNHTLRMGTGRMPSALVQGGCVCGVSTEDLSRHGLALRACYDHPNPFLSGRARGR